jgi:hypothetical protein
MVATVLNDYRTGDDLDEVVTGGHWETYQDEDTLSIKKRWVEDVTYVNTNPGQTWDSKASRFDIECTVRGFSEVGFRSSANTEAFYDGVYKAFEVVQITFPAKYVLNRRQFITNIRARNKQILWLEEETGLPTIFEVQGVTPQFDPFGRHIDNMAVLKRSDVQ